MSGPYVNDDGMIWIERDGRWNVAQAEAASWAREWLGLAWGKIEYLGIERDCRVSDEYEGIHLTDEECAESVCDPDEPIPPGWTPCCRTIEAYSFRAVER